MSGHLTYNGVRLWCKLYDPETVRKVLAAYERGSRPTKLSRRYRVPVSTIEKWASKTGVTRSHRGAARLRAKDEKGIDAAEMKPVAEKLYLEDPRVQRVADRLGVCYTTAYYWLRARGVIRKHRKQRVYSQETKGAALSMYADGYDSGVISDVLDVPAQTVCAWVRKAGMTRPNWQRHTMNAPTSMRGKARRQMAREVWRMKAEQKSIAETARRLGVAPATVRGILEGTTDPFRFDARLAA